MAEFRALRATPLHLYVATCGHGCSIEATLHHLFEASKFLNVGRTYCKLSFREVGDDVRLQPSLRNHAMHSPSGLHLLPRCGDAVKPDKHCIQCIDAFPRGSTGMCTSTLERDNGTVEGQKWHVQTSVWSRVHHHGAVHALESTTIKQFLLATHCLFGRGAQDHDCAPWPVLRCGFLHCSLQTQKGTDRRCGNQVVATGMTNLWKSIILRTDEHPWGPRAKLSTE
mmetsp:Transcript_108311/g.316853  ORF Transcript_108311/g.316853 Transcript_108311/m.316853 type:complete len:225 (+) Transcript_108311:382-1056(+)